MKYTSGTWCLPTLTKQKAAKLHHSTYLSAIKLLQATTWDSNQYRALLEHVYNSEPLRTPVLPADITAVKEINVKIMQLLHDCWGHPSNSNMEMIFRYYQGRGFPKGFLAALKNFKCNKCTICKGVCIYKHSKLVQKKIEMNKNNRRKATSTKKQDGQDIIKTVLEMEVTEMEAEDDLLMAFGSEELHMDYAHSISLRRGDP
eukprot:1135948-Rhodomonas_salina.3